MIKKICKILSGFTICVLCTRPSVFAQSNIESYIEEFSVGAGQADIENTKQLIQNFCNTVIHTKSSSIYEASSDFIFNSEESIIVYLLCKPLIETKDLAPTIVGDKAILKQTDRSNYNISCDTTSDMDSCELYKKLPKAFNTIANDLTNIKIAATYGMSNSDKTTNDLANEFSKQYFSGTALCDPKDSKDNSCAYPKTFDHLKTFITQAKSLSKQTTSIHVNKLNDRKKTTVECENKNTKYNIIVCGLLGSQRPTTYERNTQSSLKDFSNLLYNEFFWYSLFMKYYEQTLITNIKLQPFTVTSNTDKLFTQTQSQSSFIRLTNSKIQNTIEETIEQLSIIQTKFPIHIGLMMYYERLLELRQSLAKIYTPIHQLYYKLRNVQQKE